MGRPEQEARMEETVPTSRLRIADMGVLVAIALSLGGLIWQASSQAQRLNDNFTQDERRDGDIEELKIAKEQSAVQLATIGADVRFIRDEIQKRDARK